MDVVGDDVAVVQSTQVPDAAARDAVAADRQSAGRCRSAAARQRQASRLGTALIPRSNVARRPRIRSPDATVQIRCESEIRLDPTRTHSCTSACHCNCNNALRPRTDARAAGAHSAAGSREDVEREQDARADAEGYLRERRNSQSALDDSASGRYARTVRAAGGQHRHHESTLRG